MTETAREERKQLKEIAAQLLMALEPSKKAVNALVNKLIEAGDTLLPAVADEIDAARGVVERKIGYKKLADSAYAPKVQVMSASGNVVEKTQRKCSACGERGHRAGGPKCRKGRK